MGRIARSWQLMKQSWKVLMQDKELMILPLLSGLCILVIVASFALPVFMNGTTWAEGQPEWVWYAATFAFYVIAYTITFFFQAAVIAGASERMSGGDPTLGSALGAAAKRLPSLFLWGVVAATVGMIIRAIEERSELVGRIAMFIVGAAWSLATFFMVPVLVMERESLGKSFKRSWGIFKETWGETVVGAGGLGIAGFLLSLPVILLAGWLLSMGMVWPAIIIGVLGLATVSVVFSALQGVYVAAVYRYATAQDSPAGFDESVLRDAFRPKG
ncbi:MAG: DUF6159 family protein [Planctomycetota bacterium]|nr:DUF6159 family protein [Planctomycetota bacterium]